MTEYNLLRRVRRILLFGLLGVLTALSGWVNNLFTGDVYPFASVDRTVGLEALERSQGVTTDGASWIFSGKDSLVKTTIEDDTILARNKHAIPDELRTRFGSAHIGGISYANGFVYAAIEDSGQWEHPLVALFDGETLDFTGKYAELPGKSSTAENALTHGVPWVTCDTVNGFFYVAQCDDADKLFAYDLETMEYVRSIPLNGTVDEIQGGEMYNGRLYVATNDATRAVYRISLRTGDVEKYFDRILYRPKWIDNFGGEGEDLTVLPMRDGTVFHALHIGAMFIDANLRHYAPVQPDPVFEPMTDEKPTKPETTYLDRYVLNVVRSGSYTLKTVTQQDGVSVPVTYYSTPDDFALKIDLTSAVAQALHIEQFDPESRSLRLIVQNKHAASPNLYLAFDNWYTQYAKAEGTFAEMLQNGIDDLNGSLLAEGLEYRDVQTYAGYVVETYTNSETGDLHTFYFDEKGLIREDVLDAESGEVTQTYTVQLTAGVSDPDVFTLNGYGVWFAY